MTLPLKVFALLICTCPFYNIASAHLIYPNLDGSPLERCSAGPRSYISKFLGEAFTGRRKPESELLRLLNANALDKKAITSAVINFLNVTPEDPIYARSTDLGTFRDHPENVTTRIFETFRIYPGLLTKLNGSIVFHGSRSAALLSFTDYSPKKGALVPSGVLLKEKKPPFGGANDVGLAGINKAAISTAFLPYLEEALSYSGVEFDIKRENYFRETLAVARLPKYKRGSSWSPEKARKTITWEKENIESLRRDGIYREESVSWIQSEKVIELEEMRLKTWPTLTERERFLIGLNFPVVFGIRSTRPNAYSGGRGDVNGELPHANGASPDEIRLILVPEAHLEMLKSLLQNVPNAAHIQIMSFENLRTLN